MSTAQKRAGVYYDGFNVYHTIDDIGTNHLKWMCYRSLAEHLAAPTRDQVVHAKVFTAYAEWRPESAARHKIVASAWRARGAEVILGRFKARTSSCRKCGATWQSHEEKESDVNIAAHLLADCLSGTIDIAYLVSGDTDMVGALKLLRKLCPSVELVHVSVLNRRPSLELVKYSDRQTTISLHTLRKCRLPEVVMVGSQVVAKCPVEYQLPGT